MPKKKQRERRKPLKENLGAVCCVQAARPQRGFLAKVDYWVRRKEYGQMRFFVRFLHRNGLQDYPLARLEELVRQQKAIAVEVYPLSLLEPKGRAIYIDDKGAIFVGQKDSHRNGSPAHSGIEHVKTIGQIPKDWAPEI